MIFASFILIVALGISAIAAFYSIVGLMAIFAAAAVPIIVMGGALEIGKIATTVWLHQNWQRAPKAFKYYLVPAVAILMFITSMGIFGFLSKAHIEQTSLSDEQQAEISQLQEKVMRSEAKIARWNTEILRLTKGVDIRTDNLVEKDGDALNTIYAQIDKEKANARADADKQIDLQNKRLEQAAQRKASDIEAAQKRKEQDIQVVQDRFKNSFSKAKMDEAIAEINKIELEAVKTAKNNELSVASAAQREIKAINDRLNQRLKEIDAKYKPQLDGINNRIKSLRSQTEVKTGNVDKRVDELEGFIDAEQLEIDKINEESAVYEKEYRKLEAEVGPIKYVAALIYGDNPDVNMLERAVRWVIILLVVVFDPLALTLILAATKSFEWVREEKNPTYAHKEYTVKDDELMWADDELMNEYYPPQPVMKPVPVDDTRLKELEQELADKNNRINSLVKDLEYALNDFESAKKEKADNVDELEQELAQLNARYDQLVQEKKALEAQVEDLKKKF